MKKTVVTPFILLLIGLATAPKAQAQTAASLPIYLEMGNCFQTLEYHQRQTNGIETDFLDYHLPLNDLETLVFRVSKHSFSASNVSIADPSQQHLTCDKPLKSTFQQDFIQALVNGEKQAYILENGKAAKVQVAAYVVYLKDTRYLRVIYPDYSFDFDGGVNYEVGADLKTEGEGSIVFFANGEERCLPKATFVRVPMNFLESANVEYLFGVGIFKEVADDMERTLTFVNGQPLNEYLQQICAKKTPMPEVATTPEKPLNTNLIETDVNLGEGNVAKGGDETTENPLPTLYNEAEKPTISNNAEATTEGFNIELDYQPAAPPVVVPNNAFKNGQILHLVVEGDTLYNIARKYKTTVSTLKKLNRLEENAIELGQTLIVQ